MRTKIRGEFGKIEETGVKVKEDIHSVGRRLLRGKAKGSMGSIRIRARVCAFGFGSTISISKNLE